MTVKQAKKYINERFKFETELRSYAQDITIDGVFNKDQFETFPNSVAIGIAEDLKYQFKEEFGYLLNS